MNTARTVVTALLAVSLLGLTAAVSQFQPPAAPPAAAAPGGAVAGPSPAALLDPPAPAEPAPADAPRDLTHFIAAGETLSRILPRYGVDSAALLEATGPLHDLTRIRAGKELAFHFPVGSDAASAVRYRIDMDRTLVAERAEDGTWSARVDVAVYETRQGVREFEVHGSLWESAIDAGLAPADIVALSEVFRFDIDFNTEIRPGARVRMVVDELWSDGTLARLAAPVAVRLENGKKTLLAIRYVDADGDPAYFDADGQARKKPFLRSPLKFSRVTSGFSRARFHPVLKISRPHLGVDFGAPEGTPVYAVGDGTVQEAGPSGGHGRFVKLDHAGPYASSYSHLSRIAVKRGQKVKQGQIVGYVGSTGLATGPHLHYQFWVGSRIVNPMTVDLPGGGESVRDAAGFAAARTQWLALLDAPPAAAGANDAWMIADAAEDAPR
jgi:murein DD-endopeptidase MepM/ murein hydrolase activator NlpD